MLRRPVESPRSYSSSTSASGSRRAQRSLSGTFTPERSAEGTCTFSGPRLRAAIVRIPPERMQRLERVRRVLDRPHGVHTPGGGRLRGAYSGHSGSARATPPQQQGRARPPREYPPPPPPPPSGSSGQRRRRRRMRPGERALREIKRYQLSTELLLAKAPFARVVRDVLCAIPTTVHRMTLLAVEALQEASEAFLIHVLEDAYLCTIHAKRKTLMLTDVRLACRLRNGYNL